MRVVIIGLNSDIGNYLADKYMSMGYDVVGTFRTYTRRVGKYKAYYCDVNLDGDISSFVDKCVGWDLFISSVGNLKPIGRFFDTPFDEWQSSVSTNALSQLKILHSIYPFRNKDKIVDVVFFAGGGVSRPVVDYSAYTLSKVALIKMCEIINDEYEDINPFILGPGWVKTKIHHDTIPSAYNYDTVIRFLESKGGTSMEHIFGFIEQLRMLGKELVGGRNFSIHDSIDVVNRLRDDNSLFKLRRKE